MEESLRNIFGVYFDAKEICTEVGFWFESTSCGTLLYEFVGK